MKKLILFIFGGAIILSISSCSITRGSVTASSHYVYPNSNVTPLGATNAETRKFGVLIPPAFKERDLDNLYGQAMSRYQGSNLILDNAVNTKFTIIFIIFYNLKVTLSGTAAHMEVGKQDIGQKIESK